MISSVTELGTFGHLYASPSSPQVTMGCNHVLTSNTLSTFMNGKELFLQFEIVMSETSRRLNMVPRVPLRSDGLDLTQRFCGPRSRTLPASPASEHNGVSFCALESRWEKCRDGSVCCQVSLLDGQLKVLRDVAGSIFGAFYVVGVRGFAIFKDIKPSPFAFTIAEKPTRPDLVPRALWGERLSSISEHAMGAIHCVNLSTTFLIAITRPPLIWFFGYILNVDIGALAHLPWARNGFLLCDALGHFSCNLQTRISLCQRQVMLLTHSRSLVQ
jgi:hypothetical protein